MTSSCPIKYATRLQLRNTTRFASKLHGTKRMFLRTFWWRYNKGQHLEVPNSCKNKWPPSLYSLQSLVNIYFCKLEVPERSGECSAWTKSTFSHSCASSNKNTRTWDVLWKEETAGFVLEAWRSKANSENVLKNILQLTKVSFLASLQWKHTHMGCFVKGGNSWPWCSLWNSCNSRECFQECSTTHKGLIC